MGSAMQSLYSANPTKAPQGGQAPQQQRQPQWGQGSTPPTFGQMQQSGQPRPAPPPNWYRYQPGTTSGWGAQPPQRPQTPTVSTQQPQAPQSWQPPAQPPNMGPTANGYYPPPQQAAPQSQPLAAPPASVTSTPYGAPPAPNIGQYNPTATTQSAPPHSYQPPTPGQIYNGVMNNPMVQFGNQMIGFTPPPAPTGWNAPPAPPPSVSPSGPPQYGATPAASTGQQNTANQLGTATQNLLLNQLQNPDPLAQQAFQTQMQQAQTGINENMQQQEDAINSNLASRGVYDSSLAGGYLKDLSTNAGRQMASIGANLLPQEAQLQLQGQNSAIANMLGYGGQQFGQQATAAQINLAQQQNQNQQLQQLLALSGY